MFIACFCIRFYSDTEHIYNIRRNENDSRQKLPSDSYATYDQIRSPSFLSNRSNYEANHRNGHSTYPREQGHPDRTPTSARNDRRDDDDDDDDHNERPRVQVNNRPSVRIATNDNQEVNRQSYLSDQSQNRSRINYTIPHNSSGNSRSIVLDINITINLAGNRNPQVTATAETIPPRSSPIRSTAILEDMNFLDLDIRTPQRTARLVTDGSIRSSSAQQTTPTPQSNPK